MLQRYFNQFYNAKALNISDYHNSSTLEALQAKVKNVANPLSISNYLVNLATQAQGQEHAGFEKLIYLILYNERHHIFDLIRQHVILLFDFIQGAGSSLLNLLWLLIRVYSETNFCFIPSLVYIRLDRLKTHSDVVFGFDFQCKKFEYLDSS